VKTAHNAFSGVAGPATAFGPLRSTTFQAKSPTDNHRISTDRTPVNTIRTNLSPQLSAAAAALPALP
jgi:hypothetical protein